MIAPATRWGRALGVLGSVGLDGVRSSIWWILLAGSASFSALAAVLHQLAIGPAPVGDVVVTVLREMSGGGPGLPLICPLLFGVSVAVQARRRRPLAHLPTAGPRRWGAAGSLLLSSVVGAVLMAVGAMVVASVGVVAVATFSTGVGAVASSTGASWAPFATAVLHALGLHALSGAAGLGFGAGLNVVAAPMRARRESAAAR